MCTLINPNQVAFVQLISSDWASPSATSSVPLHPTCNDGVGECTTELEFSTSNSVALVSLPFAFPFFGGVPRENAYVSSNGFISFAETGDAASVPHPIPSVGAPDDLVAAYWTDLNPAGAAADGGVFYWHHTTLSFPTAHSFTAGEAVTQEVSGASGFVLETVSGDLKTITVVVVGNSPTFTTTGTVLVGGITAGVPRVVGPSWIYFQWENVPHAGAGAITEELATFRIGLCSSGEVSLFFKSVGLE